MFPFTSNLVSSEHEPNIFFKKEETGLSKDSVTVIHLIGAANKFCFERKISKLTEENYQKQIKATHNTRFNLTLPLRQMQVKRMLGGHALACKKGKKWKK